MKMMRAVNYSKEGLLSIVPTPLPTLTDGQLLLKVITTAINRADTLQKRGHYPPPPGVTEILGLEAAGTVEHLGSNPSGRWKIGDKAMALLPGGGNAEYVAVNENHLIPVPPQLDWEHAAAVPEAWLTAYQLLSNVADVREGQSILVHASASGVGTAAVQLISKLFHGVAYGTAGSEAKVNFVKGLGAKEVFNYKNVDFAEQVLKATEGKGVDVVLDCVGGEYWQKNSDCLAVDGIWVVYGLLGGGNVTGDILSKVLRKRIRIQGSTLRARSDQYKADLVAKFQANVVPLFTSGQLKPIVDSVFPFGKINEAHERLEKNLNVGKIILYVQNECTQDIEDHSMLE